MEFFASKEPYGIKEEVDYRYHNGLNVLYYKSSESYFVIFMKVKYQKTKTLVPS